jgi:hypothetical protein
MTDISTVIYADPLYLLLDIDSMAGGGLGISEDFGSVLELVVLPGYDALPILAYLKLEPISSTMSLGRLKGWINGELVAGAIIETFVLAFWRSFSEAGESRPTGVEVPLACVPNWISTSRVSVTRDTRFSCSSPGRWVSGLWHITLSDPLTSNWISITGDPVLPRSVSLF